MLPLIAAIAFAPAFDVAPLLAQVDANRMRATVEKLATWHNRNTSNPSLDEAAAWIKGEFEKIPGLQVELMRYQIHKGARIPADKEVVQVVATLPGKTDRRVIVGGHFDSINMVERDLAASLAARAPGANDDASGVALTLELARILSKQQWNQTLVFVAFSGEEQGLLGSRALAQRAKKEGWKIDGVQSNDMVGSSSNLEGKHDDTQIRVFTEDLPTHNSREMGRWIEWVARQSKIKAGRKNFGVKLVFRKDRFGRGGDHSSFNDEGFTAVRFVEPNEEYTRQHTPNDLPEFEDWKYLANVAKVNLASMARLATAGLPPVDVRIDRKQGYDTRVHWQGTPGTRYVVYWRETTSPGWEGWREVGTDTDVTIAGVSKDDYIFAVGAENGIPVEAK